MTSPGITRSVKRRGADLLSECSTPDKALDVAENFKGGTMAGAVG
jgi:hypothetical protein